MPTPNLAQLKQAIIIAEQIEKLQADLARLVGGRASVAASPAVTVAAPVVRKGKRKVSAEHRAKLAASAKARWAKIKGTSTAPAKAPAAPKKKGKLSPEGRARIVAALKARWAAKKKAGK